MDLNILIPLPVLTAGQFFKVEYSTDGINYTLFSTTETNTQFTISGLTPGTLYYVRFTQITNVSPLIECNSFVRTWLLPNEEPCVTVEGEILASGDTYQLILTFGFPSPYVNACGGYIIEYGVNNLTTLYYSTLPASIILPASLETYIVNVYAVDCQGNRILCDTIDVLPPEVDCTPCEVLSAEIIYNGAYSLKLTIQPSVPGSNVYTIYYYQANPVISGIPDPGGTVYRNGTASNPEIFYIPINPNFSTEGPHMTYTGSISDECGHSSKFSAVYYFA